MESAKEYYQRHAIQSALLASAASENGDAELAIHYEKESLNYESMANDAI